MIEVSSSVRHYAIICVLKRRTEGLEAETKLMRRMISTFLDLVMYADSDSDEEVELSPELQEMDKAEDEVSQP